MSKQLTSTSSNNDVQKNFSWRTLGPGILLASAAIGGGSFLKTV